MTDQPTCCEEWAEAMRSGTDNEGYSALVSQWPDGRWKIGSEVRPIRFCPWCGADKTKPDPLVAAAQAVVSARYDTSAWEGLNEAIGVLAGVLDSLKKDGTK